MNVPPHIFFSMLVLTAVVAVISSYILYKRRNAPGAFYFSILMTSILIWSVGYIIELFSESIQTKFIGLQIQYTFGIPYAPTLWFISSLNFASAGKYPTTKSLVLLFIVPFLTSVLMITTNIHHIYYHNFRIVKENGYNFLFKDFGFWFYIHIIYSYFVNMWGTIVLLSFLKKSQQIFRAQGAFILAGMVLPWSANIWYVFGMKSYSPLDFTPIAIISSALLIVTGIYKYGLFDIIPAARDAVIEQMNNGLLVIDSVGRVVDTNPAAQKIFSNKPLIGCLKDDLFKGHKIDWNIDESKQSEIYEIEINDSTYEIVIADVVSKIKIKSGQILTFYDITERKKNESELNELNNTKDKFFSIIAHDLRNPFSAINGLTRLLIEDFDTTSDDDKKHMIEIMNNTSENTYRMLENLLEWANHQIGRMVYEPDVYNLKDIISEVLMQIGNNAQLKGIKINSNVGDVFAYYDENMIKTVMRNLISNAIKFTHKNGTITINCQNDNGQVIVSVIDTGIGMDKKIIDCLFHIDKKITSVGTSGEKGTGLGMILCKDFIERNHGRLWVESEVGKGSTFYFSLSTK